MSVTTWLMFKRTVSVQRILCDATSRMWCNIRLWHLSLLFVMLDGCYMYAVNCICCTEVRVIFKWLYFTLQYFLLLSRVVFWFRKKMAALCISYFVYNKKCSLLNTIRLLDYDRRLTGGPATIEIACTAEQLVFSVRNGEMARFSPNNVWVFMWTSFN